MATFIEKFGNLHHKSLAAKRLAQSVALQVDGVDGVSKVTDVTDLSALLGPMSATSACGTSAAWGAYCSLPQMHNARAHQAEGRANLLRMARTLTRSFPSKSLEPFDCEVLSDLDLRAVFHRLPKVNLRQL